MVTLTAHKTCTPRVEALNKTTKYHRSNFLHHKRRLICSRSNIISSGGSFSCTAYEIESETEHRW